MHFPHITFMKTACLLLVIFSHALLPFTETNPFWKVYAAERSGAASAIAFVMFFTVIPSFIFASGFLLARKLEGGASFTAALAGRARRLLMPWLLTMLFWLVPLYTVFDIPTHMHPAGTGLANAYILGLKGRFVDHLWFLPVLFWASLIWLPLLRLFRNRFLPGLALAFGLALMVEYGLSGLKWYCFNQTTGPLVWLYLGCQAYLFRERLDAFLLGHPVACGLGMLFLAVLLRPFPAVHPCFDWLLGSVGALAVYGLALAASRSVYPLLQGLGAYRYFEANAFRFYLFHMPPSILAFAALYGRLDLPSMAFICVSFAVAFAATASIVATTHAVQRRMPEILSSMRSRDTFQE